MAPREKTPGRGADQFPLRLPDGMRDRIKAVAEVRGISMNSVIVDALEEVFPPDPTLEHLAGYSRSLIAAAELDPHNAALLNQLADSLNHLLSTASLERPRENDARVSEVLTKHRVPGWESDEGPTVEQVRAVADEVQRLAETAKQRMRTGSKAKQHTKS